jgi:hypothetical protein
VVFGVGLVQAMYIALWSLRHGTTQVGKVEGIVGSVLGLAGVLLVINVGYATVAAGIVDQVHY